MDKLYIDPAFYPYIDLFEQYYGVNVNLDITFYSLDEPTIGQCHSTSNPYIKIDPEFWFSTDDLQQKALIFHELVHCVFGFMDHENAMLEEEPYCPYSIMHKHIVPSYCLDKYYDHYIDELRDYR